MSAIDDLGVLDDIKERMDKSIESLGMSISTVRTGRPSASMLDRVFVDYFETPTPLQQLASVSIQGQSIIVNPFDKSVLKDIERGIVDSDLGMTPSNDGEKIRLNVPELTEERRKEFVKLAKSIGEDGKVALRNIRRDSVDDVKKLAKDKEMGVSEDQEKDALDAIQKITDKYVKKMDEMVANKEKELLKV
eukprot:CAMPEP_0172605458 /NCGR_PEP_ID=MMETSP1068-20121228/25692_1 /TAXON_ID=35684 /ORGANISM="Pseudopedinella elastica, Strain CCMP716" /LENGTH=190 /DNA_ID=CAMNT_0013407871 /DNA_START=173 /DNA_END=745 /DNA_ORIENTATION=+